MSRVLLHTFGQGGGEVKVDFIEERRARSGIQGGVSRMPVLRVARGLVVRMQADPSPIRRERCDLRGNGSAESMEPRKRPQRLLLSKRSSLFPFCQIRLQIDRMGVARDGPAMLN